MANPAEGHRSQEGRPTSTSTPETYHAPEIHESHPDTSAEKAAVRARLPQAGGAVTSHNTAPSGHGGGGHGGHDDHGHGHGHGGPISGFFGWLGGWIAVVWEVGKHLVKEAAKGGGGHGGGGGGGHAAPKADHGHGGGHH